MHITSRHDMRVAPAPDGSSPLRSGIVVGPGLAPMNMTDLEAVFTAMPARRRSIAKGRHVTKGLRS